MNAKEGYTFFPDDTSDGMEGFFSGGFPSCASDVMQRSMFFPHQPELVKVTVPISHPIISFCLQNGHVRLICRPAGACLLFKKSSSVKSFGFGSRF